MAGGGGGIGVGVFQGAAPRLLGDEYDDREEAGRAGRGGGMSPACVGIGGMGGWMDGWQTSWFGDSVLDATRPLGLKVFAAEDVQYGESPE